jgi:hypothetical protein
MVQSTVKTDLDHPGLALAYFTKHSYLFPFDSVIGTQEGLLNLVLFDFVLFQQFYSGST